MFKNFYQGGPYLEIFSTQDKTLMSKWKLPVRGKKEFDNEARTYVYCLQGSTSTCKIELKKEARRGAGLTQPYLMFQLKVPHAGDFSIEIGVICFSQNKRIFFSTSQKTTRATPVLRAVVSLPSEMRGKWNSLCIDVPDLVSGFWKGESFQCLESISVGGTFRLKRILTMKHFVTHSVTLDEYKEMFYSRIPKSLQLPRFLPQQMILISIGTIGYNSSLGKTPESENKSGNEINLPKYNTLGGRYSTESLPCPVTCDLDIQFNRTHPRSQSCSEGYPDTKGGYFIINTSQQNRHYRKPSQDENKVSTVYPKRTLKTVRPLFSRKDLHKGDVNHEREIRTLISESGRSLSFSPPSISPNQDNSVHEYQFSDLGVIGKKIENSCDTERDFISPIKWKEKFRRLELPDSRFSSKDEAKSHEVIQSDGHKNQQKYTRSATFLTNPGVLHSGSANSLANDVSQIGCKALEHSDSNFLDQNVKLECEELSQDSSKDLPYVVDIDSAEAKVSVSESEAEQLNDMFEKLSMDDLQNMEV